MNLMGLVTTYEMLQYYLDRINLICDLKSEEGPFKWGVRENQRRSPCSCVNRQISSYFVIFIQATIMMRTKKRIGFPSSREKSYTCGQCSFLLVFLKQLVDQTYAYGQPRILLEYFISFNLMGLVTRYVLLKCYLDRITSLPTHKSEQGPME